MTLYETIFIRRGVSKYLHEELDGTMIEDIGNFIAAAEQLDGQHARFEIVSSGAVNGPAPHYILSYCNAGDAAYANVGYILGYADLYLQSRGLGSRFYEMIKPKNPAADYCMLLAFGKPDNVPQRNGAGDFKRLGIGDISNIDNPVAEAARLAPSSVNSQPWKLLFEDGGLTIKYTGRGLMKLVLEKKMNKIDIGIVTRHAVTALEHEGRKIKSITPVSSGKDFEIRIAY